MLKQKISFSKAFYFLLLLHFYFNSNLILKKSFAQTPILEALTWSQIDDGLFLSQDFVANSIAGFKTEIILLKINLDKYELKVSNANDFKKKRASVETLTKKAGGILGINANFYGKDNKPLGLIVSNGKIINKLQKGGSVLSGVFFLRNGKPYIAHRDRFSSHPPSDTHLAVQSGPRIISNSKALKFKKSNGSTRRSGIAVTRNNREVIIYATRNRFPGAKLEDIISVLGRPELKVTDVLNFDGGGSSQFYLSKDASPLLKAEINISGGDPVPIALVAKKK